MEFAPFFDFTDILRDFIISYLCVSLSRCDENARGICDNHTKLNTYRLFRLGVGAPQFGGENEIA